MARARRVPLLLPSGRRVVVTVASIPDSPRADDRFRGEPHALGGALLAGLEAGDLTLELDPDTPLTIDDVLDWPLPDFHALRDVAGRLGLVSERQPPWTCRNCDALLDPDPRAAPLDDLGDWYAPGRREAPLPDVGARFPLPRPFRVVGAREPARDFAMEPRRVRDVLPLWRALASAAAADLDAPWPPPLPAKPAVVHALGVRALGSIRTPRRLARALENAPDDVWAALETAFSMLAYAPEGLRPVACGRCGASHEVDAPFDREVVADPDIEDAFVAEGRVSRPSGDPAIPFPDEDAFADRVVALADEVFDELGVAAVDLHVDFDVPPVDGAGEPLLGSYRVVQDEAAEFGIEGDGFSIRDRRFRIELYYQTFRRMYEDGPYDLDAEIRETLAHEVEHHFYELAGHDPMDQEERMEARRDVARMYGSRHLARADRRAELDNLRAFLKLAVPVLAASGLLAVLWQWLSGP